jgi:hypothetical protein
MLSFRAPHDYLQEKTSEPCVTMEIAESQNWFTFPNHPDVPALKCHHQYIYSGFKMSVAIIQGYSKSFISLQYNNPRSSYILIDLICIYAMISQDHLL